MMRCVPAGATEALIAKITVVYSRTLGMHPRLLLIDSQLKVPSQRTTVILAQRAAGGAGCADFGYQRQTVLIRLRRVGDLAF
eukprot:COSAG01_NODE_5679_length_4104_cov_13.740574_3_plen_82_part_00